MTDPQFASRTPRFDLPMLFAGQAQKEAFINESLARLDMLAHPAIEGMASAPPVDPSDGQMWIVADQPGGAWEGRSASIAAWIGGQWLFVSPRDGLRVFNRAERLSLVYKGGWVSPQPVASPAGGTVVDSEARAAIAALLSSLIQAGFLPAN